eukprot:334592-Rhodomonas_salina.1
MRLAGEQDYLDMWEDLRSKNCKNDIINRPGQTENCWVSACLTLRACECGVVREFACVRACVRVSLRACVCCLVGCQPVSEEFAEAWRGR